jgi:hypothetical protein
MFRSAFSIPTCSDTLNLSDFISIGKVLLIGKRSRIAEKNATISIPVLMGSFSASPTPDANLQRLKTDIR